MGEIKTFYNRYWNSYNIRVNPFDKHPEEWTDENFFYHFNFFKPFVKGRLLDFGCGDGQFLHMISKYCESSYGVDISEAAIKKATNKYPDVSFTVSEESGVIDFPDNFFDTVCAIDILEHILDVESSLEELRRILKPGGKLLIATSELTRIKMMLIILHSLDKYFYPASPHIRHFTRRNLADILTKKGFKVLRYKKNRTYFGFIPRGQMVVASKSLIRL